MSNQAPATQIQEFITEYILMAQSKKPWLVVEGESDVFFFKQRFNTRFGVTFEERNGWDGVIELLKEWNLISNEEKNGRRVVGVIDRDYHEMLGTEIPENIVMVDHRDLEIVMFECDEALNKVLLEMGSIRKLPHTCDEKLDLNEVRQVIYKLAYPLTKLRFLSAISSTDKLTFEKPFDFKKIVDTETLSLDEQKLILRISTKSKCSTEVIAALINKEIDQQWDVHQRIANGHDVISLLGKSLQKYFGTVSDSKFIEGERLESIFRMAYPNQEFENSKFGQDIMRLLGFLTEENKAA
jgi:hypothetical protein